MENRIKWCEISAVTNGWLVRTQGDVSCCSSLSPSGLHVFTQVKDLADWVEMNFGYEEDSGPEQ
jgi:hypothetical protein